MDYREAITISDLIHPLLRCAPQAPVGRGSSSGTTSVHHEEYLKLPYSQCTHSSMGWFSNGSWPLLAGQCVVIKAIWRSDCMIEIGRWSERFSVWEVTGQVFFFPAVVVGLLLCPNWATCLVAAERENFRSFRWWLRRFSMVVAKSVNNEWVVQYFLCNCASHTQQGSSVGLEREE